MKRTINEFKLNLYESVINLLSEVNNWKNVKHIADGWIKQQNIALEKLKGFYEEDNKPQSEVRKIKEGEEKEKTSGIDASAQKEF